MRNDFSHTNNRHGHFSIPHDYQGQYSNASHSTTKTHHHSVAEIVTGSVLILGAIIFPMHGIIAAAFVLAMAIAGGYLITKGINSMLDAKQPQQEPASQALLP